MSCRTACRIILRCQCFISAFRKLRLLCFLYGFLQCRFLRSLTVSGHFYEKNKQ